MSSSSILASVEVAEPWSALSRVFMVGGSISPRRAAEMTMSMRAAMFLGSMIVLTILFSGCTSYLFARGFSGEEERRQV